MENRIIFGCLVITLNVAIQVCDGGLLGGGIGVTIGVDLGLPKLPIVSDEIEWYQFKMNYSKTYESVEEEQYRKRLFFKNKKFIDDHNCESETHGYTLGINQFADLRRDEILNSKFPYETANENCSEVSKDDSKERGFVSAAAVSIASIDWRQRGGVTSVKNQGSCGSCYAFAAVGALESAHWKKYGSLSDLSEQQIVDCSSAYGNYRCEGGWMHNAFQYLQRKGGIASERDYPYTGRDGQCRDNAVAKVATVQSFARLYDEVALANAVASIGPVAVGYNAGTQAHDFYRSGILDIPNCANTPNHAVLVVGYGSENGKDFWILKNSWGTSWGEQGYFRLARNKGNMCGIASYASYPTAV